MIDPKPALRQLYRSRRRAFVAPLSPPKRTLLEQQLVAHVRAAPRPAGLPASYAAIGDEIDPQHVEADLGSHAFPRVTGRDLVFQLAAWKDMRPGFGGIPEPAVDAPVITPVLLLVPLLAAAPDGTRLGQGGGFYDRALAALRRNGPVVAIGLAWDAQIADFLPAESWDERLDYIATPTRLVACAQNR